MEHNSRQPDPATNSRQPQATTHSMSQRERNNTASRQPDPQTNKRGHTTGAQNTTQEKAQLTTDGAKEQHSATLTTEQSKTDSRAPHHAATRQHRATEHRTQYRGATINQSTQQGGEPRGQAGPPAPKHANRKQQPTTRPSSKHPATIGNSTEQRPARTKQQGSTSKTRRRRQPRHAAHAPHAGPHTEKQGGTLPGGPEAKSTESGRNPGKAGGKTKRRAKKNKNQKGRKKTKNGERETAAGEGGDRAPRPRAPRARNSRKAETPEARRGGTRKGGTQGKRKKNRRRDKKKGGRRGNGGGGGGGGGHKMAPRPRA